MFLSVLVLDGLDLIKRKEELTFATRARRQKAPEPGAIYRFTVALSFPGELREVVQPIAEALGHKLGRDKVLYDRFHEAELARPNLDVYLQTLYHEDSKFIVIFLSSDYAEKEWCGMEWRAIRDLIKSRRDADVMLLRTDSGPVPGIFSIDGYIDVTDRSPEQVVSLIMSRLSLEKTVDGNNQIRNENEEIDPENGTWSPSVQYTTGDSSKDYAQVNSVDLAEYEYILNQNTVKISFDFWVDLKEVPSGSALAIGGLPFTVKNGNVTEFNVHQTGLNHSGESTVSARGGTTWFDWLTMNTGGLQRVYVTNGSEGSVRFWGYIVYKCG